MREIGEGVIERGGRECVKGEGDRTERREGIRERRQRVIREIERECFRTEKV